MTADDFDLRVRTLLEEVQHKQRRSPRFSFSDSGACVRSHVYAFREWKETGALRPLKTPLRWVYQAGCGEGVGAQLEEAARRLGWLTQVPVRWVADNGLIIEGTADIVGPDFVLDGKFVSRSSWRAVQDAPKKEHWQQVHGYGFALDKPWVGLLYQQNKESGEDVPWLIHQGETNPSVAAMVLAHWAEVEAHRRAGTLPTRPYADPDWECANACAYADTCWGSV